MLQSSSEFSDDQRQETETNLTAARRKVAELEDRLDRLHNQQGWPSKSSEMRLHLSSASPLCIANHCFPFYPPLLPFTLHYLRPESRSGKSAKKPTRSAAGAGARVDVAAIKLAVRELNTKIEVGEVEQDQCSFRLFFLFLFQRRISLSPCLPSLYRSWKPSLQQKRSNLWQRTSWLSLRKSATLPRALMPRRSVHSFFFFFE